MNKLFIDCKTDEEKYNFFLSGRGYETGVVAASIQNDVAMAYKRCVSFQNELRRLNEVNAELVEHEQDWDLLAKTQESLREHMSKVKELEAELAKQVALDKKADNARELGLDYEVDKEKNT